MCKWKVNLPSGSAEFFCDWNSGKVEKGDRDDSHREGNDQQMIVPDLKAIQNSLKIWRNPQQDTRGVNKVYLAKMKIVQFFLVDKKMFHVCPKS